ncbi:MAG: NAD(+)/NADH kinase [Lachnospiraceae bacterium]|nr:NAD(+)/NADH kinase [Lachnospiraceae bacterium]
MEHFFVITNKSKDKDFYIAKDIKKYLEDRDKTCVIATDYGQDDTREFSTDISEIPPDTQGVIVLGGDGTMLQAANDLARCDLPILGVNLGNLGFLTDIDKKQLYPALHQLIEDNYTLEKRMLIDGKYVNEKGDTVSNLALNDVVINKGHCYHLVCVKVYINGKLLDIYIADGIIVSSPTGSTGYNLSAGGPVMVPSIKAMIITPICPHSLNNRSLVVSAEDEIVLEIGNTRENGHDEGILIMDGMVQRTLYTGESIKIKQAMDHIKLIKLNGMNFFDVFHNKLGMGKESI